MFSQSGWRCYNRRHTCNSQTYILLQYFQRQWRGFGQKDMKSSCINTNVGLISSNNCFCVKTQRAHYQAYLGKHAVDQDALVLDPPEYITGPGVDDGLSPPVKYLTNRSKAVLFVDHLCYLCLVFVMLSHRF